MFISMNSETLIKQSYGEKGFTVYTISADTDVHIMRNSNHLPMRETQNILIKSSNCRQTA